MDDERLRRVTVDRRAEHAAWFVVGRPDLLEAPRRPQLHHAASLDRLVGGLDEDWLGLEPAAERGEIHHRDDHAQHDQERRGEEERLKGEHVVSETSD